MSGVTHVPLGRLLPSRFSSVKRRAAGLIRGLRSILKQLKPSGNEVYREVRQVNMNDEGGDALAGREQKPHCPRCSPSHGLSPRFSAAPREVLGGLVRQINKPSFGYNSPWSWCHWWQLLLKKKNHSDITVSFRIAVKS